MFGDRSEAVYFFHNGGIYLRWGYKKSALEVKPMPNSEDLQFAKLVDWVEGRLSEEARAVERQVVLGDSAMREEIAWLRAFARINEDTVIALPPPRVRETLSERFEAYAEGRQQPNFLKRLVARLTFDSGLESALGWRSTSPELRRQVAYSTEAADVVISIRPRDELLDIHGRIFSVNSTQIGRASCRERV